MNEIIQQRLLHKAQIMMAELPLTVLVIAILAAVVVLFLTFVILLVKQYKRCPPNQLLVIYGHVPGAGRTQKVIHGGAMFVWPMLQDCAYVSLDPLRLELPKSLDVEAAAKGIELPNSWTIAISTDEHLMQNAAIHLIGLAREEIARLATDLIMGRIEKKLAKFRKPQGQVDSVTLLEEWAVAIQSDLDQLGLKTIGYR